MAEPPPPPLPPLAPDAAETPAWYYPLMVLLICCSAMFSGLTLGLMSLDESQLEIIIAGDDRWQRMYAEKILPIRRRGNWLLCTLLLGNTLANSILAILIDGVSWLSGPIGVIATTIFILIFGEILPQSFCSRHGLAVGYYTFNLVLLIRLALAVAAFPLSKVLDCALGEELGTQYSRTELKQLFAMQAMQHQDAAGSGHVAPEPTSGASGRPHASSHLDASPSRATAASDDRASVVEIDTPTVSGHRGIRPVEVSWLCGVLSLSERTAEQIMTPMHDVFRVYEVNLPTVPALAGAWNTPTFLPLPFLTDRIDQASYPCKS
jgi:metal transporter CNNM